MKVGSLVICIDDSDYSFYAKDLYNKLPKKYCIYRIRRIIPGCGLSQDMIAGFPGETEEDHQDTLSLMEYVKYDFGYMFAYSERPNTFAARKLEDNVPLEVKKRRLNDASEGKARDEATEGPPITENTKAEPPQDAAAKEEREEFSYDVT